MQIRSLNITNIDAWAGLLATCFEKPVAFMKGHLHWLNDGYTMIAYAAWDGDTLAAQYACLCVDLHLPYQDAPVKAGMSLNMCVHPDYRGRGLIKQVAGPVYDTLQKQAAIIGVGFSNAQGVKVDIHSKGYGYRVIGKMQSSIIWLNQKRPASSDFMLNDTLLPPPWSINFIHTQNLHFMRDAHTIIHRYLCHPDRTYQYGVWKEGEQVRGIIIYRYAQIMGLPVASLLAAYSDDLPTLLMSWAAALYDTGHRAVHILSTPNAHMRQAISMLGISAKLPYTRTPYYLTAKSLQLDTPATLFDFSRWDCTGGDIL